MKPAAFNYHRPSSVEEALTLQANCEDPRFIAGGQSLVPMMSLRLAAPSDLIDLNTVNELFGISQSATHLRIGAMTRQEDLVAHETLVAQIPAVTAVVESVGHPGTRTRGTIGGSLCHADPAAELPALLLAVDAEVIVATPDGATRRDHVKDFFDGYFENSLAANELLTELQIPLVHRRRMGFHEVALRSADFAIAGAIASAQQSTNGLLEDVRVVTFALGDRPQRLPEVEAAVMATEGDMTMINEAAQLTEDLVSPADEAHLSASYRSKLGATVVRRALESALQPDARPAKETVS